MRIPRILIAGTHSGVGKTTVTLALMAAFRGRGRQVQPFKVGPDFIDPGHHTMVCGRPSRNLDGWMLGQEVNRDIFLRAAHTADLSIIEGMMGLFDGSSSVDNTGSSAEQAKQLGVPVLLVVDGSALARSVAAMVYGYANFDPDVHVAGVLFNRVNSPGHYALLKEAVEQGTGVHVVGYLRHDPELTITDRHLGLRTAIETPQAIGHSLYKKLGHSLSETVDLESLEQLAQSVGEVSSDPLALLKENSCDSNGAVRVGVAFDEAFCFYYPENLELLEQSGAELIRFSPIHGRCLPDVDLLYIGGGYPELKGKELSENSDMRKAIQHFAERGGPMYAECGGMMYLTQSIRDFEEKSHSMVGLFPVEAVMNQKDLILGYREVELTQSCVLGEEGLTVRGHEFHYSSLESTGSMPYACRLRNARGREQGQDGLVFQNVIAMYAHLHFASQPSIAQALVAAARSFKKDRYGMRTGTEA